MKTGKRYSTLASVYASRLIHYTYETKYINASHMQTTSQEDSLFQDRSVDMITFSTEY